ncbi:phosphopantetheine-binding protein [Azorhizophilus paspali]|uniref:phosphopantetheine-binding protein n=1 Tax=Azorhizophilus paspali TaxID=69963 RepID=UPI003637CA0A
MTDAGRSNTQRKEHVEAKLCEDIAKDLGITVEQLDVDDNFLKLGMDSMRLMAWMHRLRKRGYKIKLRDLYQQPTLRGWSQLLHNCSSTSLAYRSTSPEPTDSASPPLPFGQPWSTDNPST